MKLKEYIDKYNISPMEIALKCGLSLATIYNCINGKIPKKITAIRIEVATNKKVTVKELRGEENDEESIS